MNKILIEHNKQVTFFNDNDAMITSMQGEGVAKAVRHMESTM